jgi:peptidoglycan/LPS O-acetylase OafA/YrhL
VFAFWVKRAFRLWPTAWFWLAVILAVTASFQFQAGHLSFPPNVDATLAGALHFANFRFADSFGVYSYGASFQFWTLSLEEQFYLLLPLLALLSGKRLVLVLPILIAIDLLRPVSLLSITTRSSALLIGVLIAIFSQTSAHKHLSEAFGKLGRWAMFVLMIGSVALVPLAELSTPNIAQFHYGYVAAAAGLCVLLASLNRGGLCPPGVWTAVTQWLGARSYAIYVIHVPAFLMIGDVVQARLGDQIGQIGPAVATALASCCFVLLLAELNFRLVEAPLRKIGVGLAGRMTRAHVGGTVEDLARSGS